MKEVLFYLMSIMVLSFLFGLVSWLNYFEVISWPAGETENERWSFAVAFVVFTGLYFGVRYKHRNVVVCE